MQALGNKPGIKDDPQNARIEFTQIFVQDNQQHRKRCLILNGDLITLATHSRLSGVGDTPFDNHVFWKDNGL